MNEMASLEESGGEVDGRRVDFEPGLGGNGNGEGIDMEGCGFEGVGNGIDMRAMWDAFFNTGKFLIGNGCIFS